MQLRAIIRAGWRLFICAGPPGGGRGAFISSSFFRGEQRLNPPTAITRAIDMSTEQPVVGWLPSSTVSLECGLEAQGEQAGVHAVLFGNGYGGGGGRGSVRREMKRTRACVSKSPIAPSSNSGTGRAIDGRTLDRKDKWSTLRAPLKSSDKSEGTENEAGEQEKQDNGVFLPTWREMRFPTRLATFEVVCHDGGGGGAEAGGYL